MIAQEWNKVDTNEHATLDGKSTWDLNPTQRTTGQLSKLGKEEVAWPREEHISWLSNAKWSPENIYASTIIWIHLLLIISSLYTGVIEGLK